VLKRSQRSLMSIIRSFAQRRFSANNERLLVAARCSTTLSKFEVVLNRIPKYLKVCTCSITSLSNTNSLHGSTELNNVTFVSAWTTLVERTYRKPYARKQLNIVNNGMCSSSPASIMNSAFIPSKPTALFLCNFFSA